MTNKLKPINELTKCPHCGGDSWYVKQSYGGRGIFVTNFDGSEADNTDQYAYVIHKTRSKFAYCGDCNRKIAILE